MLSSMPTSQVKTQTVIPMGSQVRAFVDALGRLNQDVASACRRVTLMVAGLALTLKDMP